jgi:hypothetical protein
MRHRRMLCRVVSVVLLACCPLPGSGLIGLGLGSAAGESMSRSLPPRTISQVIPGTHIEITLRNGQVLKGDFTDGGRASEADYARRYGAWRDTSEAGGGFPGIGDTIALSYADGRRVSGMFRGFNYRGIEFHAAGDSTARLTTYACFAALEGAPDRALAADSLDHLDAAGRLPSLAQIQVRIGRQVVTLPMERVVSVKVPQSLLQKLAATGPAGEVGATAVGVGVPVGIGVGVWLLMAGMVAAITTFFTWWIPNK